jgi:hypothetical protein
MQSETKTHSADSVSSTCQNCKSSFIIEPDDSGFYKKIDVPPPTLCPECRFQRRLLFRNERDFYKRNCDLCGKDMIAVYPKDFKTPVYCVKCWWSDKWDAAEYGREYDPSRPFLEQFKELFYEVPMLSMQNDDGIGSVNCQYTYDFAFSKNCYLVMCNWETENGMYSYHICQSKDIADSYYSNHCNLSYELVNSYDCYGCRFCTLCVSCHDCYLGYDLRGCSDCVLCVGLRNKRYCILNEQYSKEEYEKKKKEMQLGNRDRLNEYRKQLDEFSLRFPRRFAHIFKSPMSTGNILYNCKASRNCFYYQELEDCRYMIIGDGAKNTYDCSNTGHPDLCYEGVTPDNSYRSIGTVYCWKCNRAEYSNNCHSSSNILGCSGIRHKEYVILNKQYSKEEYVALREKIVEQMKRDGEWGEFFPVTMSPHAYNESPAHDWVPLTKEQALEKGFRWKEQDVRDYKITLPPENIPKTISEVDDTILDEVLGCLHEGKCDEKCTTAFKIVPQELDFYRKMDIPLPQFCHNCRYYQRLRYRNPPKLWPRQCMCDYQTYKNTTGHSHHPEGRCPNEFETSYSPERKEIVYCEECYNAEIV